MIMIGIMSCQGIVINVLIIIIMMSLIPNLVSRYIQGLPGINLSKT